MGEIKRKPPDIHQQISATMRADSWVNTVTGLGSALDRVKAGHHVNSTHKSDQHYEDLMASDPVAYRIAHLPAREMLRQGFRLDLGDDADTELKTKMMAEFDRLGGAWALIEAMTFARAIGGAAVFIGADDGGDISQPLNLETLRQVRYLKVLVKQDLIARSWYTDPNDDKFGTAETFDVIVPAADGGISQLNLLVHESRLLRFDGIVTTDRRKTRNRGWGDSIYLQVEDTLAMLWSATQGLSNVLADADQAVFKLKGLNEIIKGSSEGTEAIQTKLSLLQHGRSVARAVAIDADTEAFEYQSRSFQGYDSGLYAIMYIVSAATGIPVTLLFGMSPGGLNATGASDIRFFYDAIKGEQELRLLPKLRRLFEVLFACKEGPAAGVVPDDWSITFVSLMQSSPTERADIRLKTAQADDIEINAGVITAEEAAKSHYGGDEYCQDVYLDADRDLSEPLETPADKQLAAQTEAKAQATALMVKMKGAPDAPANSVPPNGK